MIEKIMELQLSEILILENGPKQNVRKISEKLRKMMENHRSWNTKNADTKVYRLLFA